MGRGSAARAGTASRTSAARGNRYRMGGLRSGGRLQGNEAEPRVHSVPGRSLGRRAGTPRRAFPTARNDLLLCGFKPPDLAKGVAEVQLALLVRADAHAGD